MSRRDRERDPKRVSLLIRNLPLDARFVSMLCLARLMLGLIGHTLRQPQAELHCNCWGCCGPLLCRPEDVRARFERYGEVRDIYLPKVSSHACQRLPIAAACACCADAERAARLALPACYPCRTFTPTGETVQVLHAWGCVLVRHTAPIGLPPQQQHSPLSCRIRSPPGPTAGAGGVIESARCEDHRLPKRALLAL